jgi:hypothetical protein
MTRHVIAQCTDGRKMHFPISADDRIILAGVGFRNFAKRVITVDDARAALGLIPKSAPLLDVMIVDDTLEDIHKYFEE